jgi:hypothetical protein
MYWNVSFFVFMDVKVVLLLPGQVTEIAVPEIRILRKIFGATKEELTGE